MIGLTPLLELPGLQSGCSYVAVDPALALAVFTVQVLHDLDDILLSRGVITVSLAVEHPYRNFILDEGLYFLLGPVAKAAVCQSTVKLNCACHAAQVTIALYECCYQIRTDTNQLGGDQGSHGVAYAYDLVLIYVPVLHCVIQNTCDLSRRLGQIGMYVYAHDDGFGNCLMPLGHHNIVYSVVAQVGCRCIYACLIHISQLPVAYAAACLVEDYRVLLRTIYIVAFRIDYMYRNLALGIHHLVHDGVSLSLPAGIYHLKLDLIQSGLVLDLAPYGIL